MPTPDSGDHSGHPPGHHPTRSADHGAVLRRALEATIVGDARAADLFAEDVVGWAPTIVVFSRDELVEALSQQEDAFTDVEIAVDALDVIGDKAFAEWRLSAVFSGPFLVDDDVLIEPNGQRLLLAGVSIAEFRGAEIRNFRHYFDDAALLEQMLVVA